MKYFINVTLLGLMTVNLVKVSYLYLVKKEWKEDLWASLGWRKINIPKRKDGKIRIWVHAVSLGETKAIESFILHIRKELPDVEIVKSSITKTGHNQSKKRTDIFDHSFYLPVDFSWRSRKLVKKIDPDLFILVENDYWPNLLNALKAHGTKIALVNGRISKKSFELYKKVPSYSKKVFGSFDILCLQTQEHLKRFQDLGISADNAKVTGNIKFDASTLLKTNDSLNFPKNKSLVTIASTHEGEEELILDSLESMDDSVCLLIAPRHPERFQKVAEMLNEKGISYRKINETGNGNERVILVDMMGILDECFKNSKLAIVGGSFVQDIGGHNIFEPARLGIPVVYGPYMHNQEILVETFKKHNVGKQVELGELKSTLENYLGTQEKEPGMETLIEEVAGATQRSWEFIKKL